MQTKKPLALVSIALLALILLFGCAQQKPVQTPAGEFNSGHKIVEFDYTTSSGKQKTLAVALWYPTEEMQKKHVYTSRTGPLPNLFGGMAGEAAIDAKISGKGPFPLVVFSHGYGGCGVQSIYFTEELARHGYIVAAPDHNDSLCSSKIGADGLSDKFDLSIFLEPKKWNDTFFLERRDDSKALIDEMLRLNKYPSSDFFGKIDEAKIGASGHSLGGYTAFSLAGGWGSWKDNRIKAALLLSPYLDAHELHSNFSKVDVPVMIQWGALEIGKGKVEQAVFGKIDSQKFLIEVGSAGHLTWTNFACSLYQNVLDCTKNDNRARLINEYSIAFFDKYLKNDPKTAETLSKKEDGLTEYLFEIG